MRALVCVFRAHFDAANFHIIGVYSTAKKGCMSWPQRAARWPACLCPDDAERLTANGSPFGWPLSPSPQVMVGQKRGRDAGDDLLDDGALPKKKVRRLTDV